MENLLNTQSICYLKATMNQAEECGFNGDYTLPDYCPDVAMILKCMAEPRLHSRQIMTDKVLLDGVVNLRVLYLDEGRRCVRSVEFSVPYSCMLRCGDELELSPVLFHLSTKYVTCRATNPRHIEVHGALQVQAEAYNSCTAQMATPAQTSGLYVQSEVVEVSKMVGATEKVVSISEGLEFPHTLPAAEMLLGGSCTAYVTEWKVLSGKVIARGIVRVHQLYTNNQEAGTTHCLDYEVPFSQILDVNGAKDGCQCHGNVQIMSDTERCGIGPDGGNTVLEVTAKLMLQLYVFEKGEMPLLLDAYHTQHPVKLEYEQLECKAYNGCRCEQTTLPMQIPLPEAQLQELLDVWVTPQSTETVIKDSLGNISGTLLVSILGRDVDGQIVYREKAEDYRLEFPCEGNKIKSVVKPKDVRYRVVDGKLELQVELLVWLHQYNVAQKRMVCGLSLNEEQHYPISRCSALLYYGQPGESLWEIARECHTSPDAIRDENDGVGERIVQPCVLMVPIV